MPHLSPSSGFLLSIKVQLGHWIRRKLLPTVDVVPQEIAHHRIAIALGGTKRQTGNGPNELLKL